MANSVEVVLSARDEATAKVRALKQELAALGRQGTILDRFGNVATRGPSQADAARAAVTGAAFAGGRAVSPAVRETAGGLTQIAGASTMARGAVAELSRGILGIPLGRALGVISIAMAVRALADNAEKAATSAVALNTALRSGDVQTIAGAYAQVNAELEKMGELGDRAAKGGLAGIGAALALAKQRAFELLGFEAKPEERAVQARFSLKAAGQVAEGIRERQVGLSLLGIGQQGAGLSLTQALAAGNLRGAQAARQQIRDVISAREGAELGVLKSQQAQRRPPGEITPATLAREEKEQAEVRAKYSLERHQQLNDEMDLNRQLAVNRAQNLSQELSKSRDVALAKLDGLRQVVNAEAGRALTLDQHSQAERQAIAITRQIQLDSIKAIANAQAAAAAGPTRGQDIARIRKDQALDEQRVNQETATKLQLLSSQTLTNRMAQEQAYFQLRRTLGDATMADEVRHQQAIVDATKKGTDARIAAELKLAEAEKAFRLAREAAALASFGGAEQALQGRGWGIVNLKQIEAEQESRKKGAEKQIRDLLANRGVMVEGNVFQPGIMESIQILQQQRGAREVGAGGGTRDALRTLLQESQGKPDIGSRFSVAGALAKERNSTAIEANTAALQKVTAAVNTLAGAAGEAPIMSEGGAPISKGVGAAGERRFSNYTPGTPLPTDSAQDREHARRIISAVQDSFIRALETEATRGMP